MVLFADIGLGHTWRSGADLGSDLRKVHKAQQRSTEHTFLHSIIAENDCRVTKDMHDCPPTRERKEGFADGTVLRRYLNWDMDAPSCLKLEATLWRAIQNTSECNTLHLTALLMIVRSEAGWLEALSGVIESGLKTFSRLQIWNWFYILNKASPWLALDVLGNGGVACCAARSFKGHPDASQHTPRASPYHSQKRRAALFTILRHMSVQKVNGI